MKIYVYAIAKNEAKFVDRWMDSAAEADGVFVLDTGSTDGTAARLRARGARVAEEKIDPWRFDAARNRSLESVPRDADLCVSFDLDEVFRPGWREQAEEAAKRGASRISYRYVWSFGAGGREGTTFRIAKMHRRLGYRWAHPVHETLEWVGAGAEGETVFVPGILLEHHPDAEKPRGQYLPLLELAVREDPTDARDAHYLGREYFFRGRWTDCIRTLRACLALPRSTWREERSAAMRYIARSYAALGDRSSAVEWFLRAVAEAPRLREPAVDFARFLYDAGEWNGVIFFTDMALAVRERDERYIVEAEAWGSLPYDLRACAFHRLGRRAEAAENAREALRFDPENDRLRRNAEILSGE